MEHLSAEEARDVLRRLLMAHPDLRTEADTIARSRLSKVTFETIADELEEAMSALDIEALDGRAGRHAWGYVEPTDAAWEVLEEAVQPFMADIRRLVSLHVEAGALELCKGVVLGLYRVEQNKGTGLLEWAPDFPAEAAGNAIEAWRTGGQPRKATGGRSRRKHPDFPQEFANLLDSEWRRMIARILSRKR